MAGTKARLNKPGQGVFVFNKEYEDANKEDCYDFYFTDRNNHCIRKLTPDGVVSTFAGRGSTGMNVHANGYVDGHLRDEARFNYPYALAYDEDTETFYVGDVNNTAIEHELALRPDSWEYIRSQSFINNYRNQTTIEQRERYQIGRASCRERV